MHLDQEKYITMKMSTWKARFICCISPPPPWLLFPLKRSWGGGVGGVMGSLSQLYILNKKWMLDNSWAPSSSLKKVRFKNSEFWPKWNMQTCHCGLWSLPGSYCQSKLLLSYCACSEWWPSAQQNSWDFDGFGLTEAETGKTCVFYRSSRKRT